MIKVSESQWQKAGEENPVRGRPHRDSNFESPEAGIMMIMGRGVRTECTADIPLETKLPPCDGYPGTSGRQVRVTVCVVGLLIAIGKISTS